MPTYEYACKDCDHGFDIVQSFSDDALTECPECKGKLKKVFGNVGISFKGSGFYKNDNRGGPAKAAAKTSDSSSDSGSKSSSDAGSSSSSSSSDSSSSSSTATPSSSGSGNSHGHSHGAHSHTH